MSIHDIGYSLPFSALALKPFAVLEKESAGPLNHLIVEIPEGVAGAGNGYGVVTVPLTASSLADEAAHRRWPGEAFRRDGACPHTEAAAAVLGGHHSDRRAA